MKEFKYTITDPEGIHARPAGLFVKAAAAYPCAVTIIKDGKAGTGNHDPHRRRSGRGSLHRAGEVLQGEPVKRNVQFGWLRKL